MSSLQMKNILTRSLLASILCAATLFAQRADSIWTISIDASMAMSAISPPSLVDYINTVSQLARDERVGDFIAVPEFRVTAEMQIAAEWAAGVEYQYGVKTLQVAGQAGQSQFDYSANQIGAVLHYVIAGTSYDVRLGGGAAYLSATFREALYGNPLSSSYDAHGVRLKGEIIGDTKLGESLWATIGLDASWVTGGAFQNGSANLRVGGIAGEVSSFSFGLSLGIMFRFLP